MISGISLKLPLNSEYVIGQRIKKIRQTSFCVYFNLAFFPLQVVKVAKSATVEQIAYTQAIS
jgi:hypothetical protein